MDQITLTYFDLGGRAESTRLCFYIGDIQFKDERLSFEQFQEMKKNGQFKYGQIPVLNVNGTQFAQSGAIMRFAARKAGLYPSNEVLQLQAEQALLSVEELVSRLSASVKIQDEQKKKLVRQQLAQETIPQWLGNLNKLLENNKTGYFVGSALTVADLECYNLLKWIKGGQLTDIPSKISQFPLLEQLFAKVSSYPKVMEWNEKHQK